MDVKVEVAIVGAGPAGARAAELLARDGTDVVLLDPKAPWEKPCGGGLTSHLFADFPDLEQVRAMARPIEHARIELDLETGFDVRVDRPIWMISRESLGCWQLDRALEAGAAHVPARVTGIHRTRDGWKLETDSGSLDTAFLVGADGAASTVRRAVAPELQVELLPTRVAYPRIDEGAPGTLVLRFYPDLVGYLWDFPRLDHRSVGIEAGGGGWQRPALDARVDEYGATGGGTAIASLAHAGAVIGTARLGHGDFSGIAGPEFALLGDAAGFADPFTGEGIRNAIRSAHLLTEAWMAGPRERARAYRELARSAFAREFVVARLLRRSLSESGVGVKLVRRAVSRDLAYAVVAATLGTVSVHDFDVGHFLTRGVRAWREIRAHPDRRGSRAATPPPHRA
jgi:geranylgeranyl reductase